LEQDHEPDGWPAVRMRDITALLDALDAVREDGWQPIETAPKDGTRVMLGNEHGTWIGDWRPVYQSGYRPEDPWASAMLNHDHIAPEHRYKRPTHRRHLPAIDQARGKGGCGEVESWSSQRASAVSRS